MPLQATAPHPREPIDGLQATTSCGPPSPSHGVVALHSALCALPRRAAPTATLPQAQHECVERVAGSTNLALPQQEARAPTLRDALDYRPALVIQGLSRATQQPRLSIRVASV